MLDTKTFLQQVITGPTEGGWFCLAIGNGHGGWLDTWHKWPEDIDKIVEAANKQADNQNVYFSSYLFKSTQSLKENVLPSRTIQADLDNADIDILPKEPTVLVQTSEGRHQGYWVLDRALPAEEHEALSRRLTYAIPLCDRSGWPLGRKVRLPGTKNHKYLTGPQDVTVVRAIGLTYATEELEALPDVPRAVVEHYSDEFIERPQGVDTHPQELLDQIKAVIPVSVYVQYDIAQTDRSEALYALMCHGFKAGLNRDQVFTLAKGSANNKFADLRSRADQALAKDVLRAEYDVNTNVQDPRQLVHDIFKSPLTPIERKRAIYSIILSAMKAQGEFLHENNGYSWYIRRDVGRPIAVTKNSEQLGVLLDVQFGLNPTEPESQYVGSGLRTHVLSMPENAIHSSLSYYDKDKRHLLLHTGRKSVLCVSTSGIDYATDGAYGVVFPWSSSVEPFSPSNETDVDWGDELFGNGKRGFGSSVDNITNMGREQAIALLKVWLIFVLIRNAASSRPIIAALGQPGSGKTMVFRKVYALLFGRYKSISGVTSMDDFDYAVASDPLHILDNVDTWEKWLPDRIALSAGTSDVTKRKLYTDTDTITLRRQAVVGVTAHNPKFGREDVADRFLLFMFSRFESFRADSEILNDILSRRNAIWGAVIKDIQKVLNTPMPTHGLPQFRIEDFAKLGLWIARGIGVEGAFATSVENVKTAQQDFSIAEEGLLAGAILKFVETSHKNAESPKWYTGAQLWGLLESIAADQRSFQNTYRNSVTLAKKLVSLEVALSRVVNIERRKSDAGGSQWKLTSKKEGPSDANSE